YKDKFSQISFLQKNQFFSKEIALFLESLSLIKANCLIIGERNTFKTTLLSALAKKIPLNHRGILIDYMQELEIDTPNFVNYNFSSLEDENTKKSLINSIFYSSPEKILLNDCKDLDLFMPHLLKGYKGLVATLEASSIENAFQILSSKVKNFNPSDYFNVLILLKKDELQGKKIDSIWSLKHGLDPQKVFYLDDSGEYKSTGIIPDLCKDKMVTSIFDTQYKHTYQPTERLIANQPKLKQNKLELLRKLKKPQNHIKEAQVVKDLIKFEEFETQDEFDAKNFLNYEE
ncbi:Flp pilus assembly complex ATPase component TadA, partial [bacterium]|nr:Flp pilus assembly complex ATPase component TadA [bacterium]